MDPVTAVGAASRAFTGGTSAFYAVKDLVSVVVPGTVVLGELWYLAVVATDLTEPGGVLQQVVGFSTLQAVLVSVFALAAAYIIGFLCREFAFLVLGLFRVQGSTAQILAEIGALDGMAGPEKSRAAELVERIRAAHPVLDVAAAGAGASGRQHPRREGSLLYGGHAHSRGDAVDYVAFSYCKLWLRTHAPRLSVDHIEIEINVLSACLVPTALLGGVMIAGPGDAGLALRIVIGGLVLVSMYMFVRGAVALRQRERFEAVRNVCFDYMMRMAGDRLDDASSEAPVPSTPREPPMRT